jgi:hypothetical protein
MHQEKFQARCFFYVLRKMSEKIVNLFEEILKKEGTKRGFKDIRLLQKWNEIIEDDDLGNKIKPYKMIFGNYQRKQGNILIIELIDVEIKYNFEFYKQNIINKINLYFGENFIINIKVKNLDY